MSIAVDTDRVIAFMVGGEWFRVVENSFDVDAGGYEVFEDHVVEEKSWYGAIVEDKLLGSIWVTGPVTAIQALKVASPSTQSSA